MTPSETLCRKNFTANRTSPVLTSLAMLNTAVRPFIRPCRPFFTRTYATSSEKELPFIYQYATPLMKCTGIAIATNLTLQALFNTLEYADYRKGMDGKMEEIEERLKKLEGNISH